MFIIGDECVVCECRHLRAHDRACLADPYNPRVTKGQSPRAGTERWWLTWPPDPDGRLATKPHLAALMAGIRWREFDGIADAVISFLSWSLQEHRWVLSASAGPVAHRSIAPYALIAITHNNHTEDRSRTFWIAGDTRSGRAGVFALDLSTTTIAHPMASPYTAA